MVGVLLYALRERKMSEDKSQCSGGAQPRAGERICGTVAVSPFRPHEGAQFIYLYCRNTDASNHLAAAPSHCEQSRYASRQFFDTTSSGWVSAGSLLVSGHACKNYRKKVLSEYDVHKDVHVLIKYTNQSILMQH
jgi:hypothetical protein